METLVPPALAASAPERARAVQAVLDKHGPEMDRRRELTPEVVDALAGQDLLRMLLPKSMGGQEVPLVDYCKASEAIAWADASTAWFVNQSNVSMATVGRRRCRTRRPRRCSTARTPASPGARGTTRARRSASRAAIG